MKISHHDAATMLSEYLSMLFRADITVPMPNPETPDVRLPTIQRFIEHLPKVVQRAVDGAELSFYLPLVQGGKGTSLSPQVAQTVNVLLSEAFNSSDPPSQDPISVPTFFYNDGSTMVIVFNPMMLAIAVQMMVQNSQVMFFVKNGIIKARG
jgi:hypothetical protein